jgi:diguanylate cyclase (GGDEF)-like protein
MGTSKKKIQDLLKENRRLRILCDRDFLTGLFCRRKLEEDIWRYSDLNKRHKIKFSILMIDINKFKEINDTAGHKRGDKVLRQVAYILQKTLRASDRAYRLGGDEFVIIFSHHKTKVFIQRIKDALKTINLSISTGYCDLDNGRCMEQIDKRMYEEKRK